MSYIGSTPTTQSFIAGTDYFNGDGSTVAFTLSRSVVSVNDIEVVINNVVQQPNTAYTISGTTITFTSAPSAGTGNIYVRYLSTTTQSITPSQNTVSYSTLNSDTQSKLGISFKNRIINGAMVIDQRNAGASVSSGSTIFTLDRWACTSNIGVAKCSVQQNAGAVTPPVGFANYLGVTSTSAYSIPSGEIVTIAQRIEGYNIADLNWGTASAKTVTLSFWVRSSLTGTFAGSLRNGDSNRTYPYTYTINSANTWEQKSITITGDTTGTWLTTNGVGMSVFFVVGAGSTFDGTADVWQSGNYLSVSGATNILGTSGATFYLTGVQLEVGTQATTFDYRSYGTELALCQRYYYRIKPTAINQFFSCGGQAYGSGSAIAFVPFPVTMRITPTSLDQSGTASDYKVWGSTGSGIALTSVPTINGATNFNVASVDCQVTTGLSAGFATAMLSSTTNAYLGWSAEL